MRGYLVSVALTIFAVTGFTQDDAPAPAPAADGAEITKLITAFQKASGSQEKRKAVAKLYALGEPAMKAVEDAFEAAKKAAAAAEGEAKGAAKKTLKHARKIRDAMYMQIVIDDFVRIREKHPDQNLTFAGQFSHLKKHGKRAAIGALLLMKDIGLHTEADRAKAWEVLADVGDKSVMAELKEIATDYLYEDAVQTGAASALASLGDTSVIEEKIKELEKRYHEQKNLGLLIQIALTYSHGRQYKQATKVYDGVIGILVNYREQNADQMQPEQAQRLESDLANVYYNSACTHSLMKNLGPAYTKLGRCLKLAKSRYIKLIARDGDFRNLRADVKFKTRYENAKKGEFPPEPKPAPKPDDGAEEGKPEPEKPAGESPPAPQSGGKAEPDANKSETDSVTQTADTPLRGGGRGGLASIDASKTIDRWLAADAAETKTEAVRELAAAGPAAAREILARAAANPAAKPLYEEVCRIAVVARFAALRGATPDMTLTFAGQFDDLKQWGSGATVAALAILADVEENLQDRRWAADALADLADPSATAPLRDIAADFLFEDEIQEMAAYALSALGEPRELEAKIEALRKQRQQNLGTVIRIARLYYRGRQYPNAIGIYQSVLEQLRKQLDESGSELPPEAIAERRRLIASLDYSLACNQSLASDTDASMKTLERCVRLDEPGHYAKSIARDGDLRKVRARPDYAAWYARLTGAGSTSAKRRRDL